nr:zonadhesin-like protein 15 [Limnephilus flavicornis]
MVIMKPFITILLIGLFTNAVFGNDCDGSQASSPNCTEVSPPGPPKCPGKHEVYTECGNDSCVRDCETIGLTDIACRPACNPGCICQKGYLRNKQNKCVKPQHCGFNVCPGKNQEYTQCVNPCGEDCGDLGHHVVCNFLVCNEGCDCKPGFFRNAERECVPPSECVCGENEEYDPCHNPCPPEDCASIGRQYKCAVPAPEDCKPACKCKLNFKRDNSGKCVDIRECLPPFECKENEVYDACPGFCQDERCVTEPLLACASIRIMFHVCQPQCRCKTEHCRNKDQKCQYQKGFGI